MIDLRFCYNIKIQQSIPFYSVVRILLGVLILPDCAGSSNIYIYIYILQDPEEPGDQQAKKIEKKKKNFPKSKPKKSKKKKKNSQNRKIFIWPKKIFSLIRGHLRLEIDVFWFFRPKKRKFQQKIPLKTDFRMICGFVRKSTFFGPQR